jgi:hypothetical protein
MHTQIFNALPLPVREYLMRPLAEKSVTTPGLALSGVSGTNEEKIDQTLKLMASAGAVSAPKTVANVSGKLQGGPTFHFHPNNSSVMPSDDDLARDRELGTGIIASFTDDGHLALSITRNGVTEVGELVLERPTASQKLQAVAGAVVQVGQELSSGISQGAETLVPPIQWMGMISHSVRSITPLENSASTFHASPPTERPRPRSSTNISPGSE